MVKIHPYNRFGRLKSLSSRLEQLASERWGVTSIQAPFVPLVDPNLGDLGCDFPTRVAAALRRPAIELGREMADLLKSQNIDFLVYEGFLNVRIGFASGQIDPRELSDLPLAPPRSVLLLLAPRSSRESKWGVLRRAALLGLQRFLFESVYDSSWRSQIVVVDSSGEVLPDPIIEPQQYWQRVFAMLHESPQKKSEAATILGKIIETRADSMTYVWSAEEIWNQNQYKGLQEKTDLMIQFASPAWLEEWGSASESESFCKAIMSNPFDAYYLLSDPMRGSDLDGSILGSQERANLRWYESETVKRLARILSQANALSSMAVPWGDLRECFGNPSLRNLLMQAMFLKDFMIHGAERGQIWTFLRVSKELLDSTNRIMNDPGFRQDLHEGRAAKAPVGLLNKIITIFSSS
jgi:hypothetical protein